MKKRYEFPLKNCLSFSLLTAFTVFATPELKAQNGPAIQWDRTFGGSNSDHLRALQQTSDGGYILGGLSGSGISGDKTQTSKGLSDFWVIKLDATGNKLWDKGYGGSGIQGIHSLHQTSDGGYTLGGWSNSPISGDKTQASRGDFDFWIVKLDTSGSILWDKTYGSGSDDRPRFMQKTSDGGYIMGGSSASGISGDKTQASKGALDYWVIKLDAAGNKQWDKTIGGNDTDLLFAGQQTVDGGYILAGISDSPISGDKSQASRGGNDYWIVKTDANGNKLWDKTYGGSDNNDYLYSVHQTTDGGYIIGGASHSAISGDKTEAKKGSGYDYWILKLDSNGNKIWDRSIGGNLSQELSSLQQTSDGGYILAGISVSNISGDKTENSRGGHDYWIVKLDNNGTKIWDKTLGGSNPDWHPVVQETSDNGYIIGGATESGLSGDKTQASQGGHDYWIVKLAPDVLGTKGLKSSFTLTLSPNPSHGNFHLHLSGLSAPTAEVTVTDLLGRVILQQQFIAINAQLSEEIILPAAKGMYLLQIKVGGQITSRKIVVE